MAIIDIDMKDSKPSLVAQRRCEWGFGPAIAAQGEPHAGTDTWCNLRTSGRGVGTWRIGKLLPGARADMYCRLDRTVEARSSYEKEIIRGHDAEIAGVNNRWSTGLNMISGRDIGIK
jgi:hypothetical protein